MLFDEYVHARGPALLRLAYVLTGDSHLAQDLTQDALLRAYRRWDRVLAADHPDAYVRRIMINEYSGWQRRRRWTERPVHALDDPVGAWSGELVDHTDDLAARDEMRTALAALAPRARTVMVLRYYGDLSDTAIADLLGVAPSTVRATASKALRTLRTHYDVTPAWPAEELR